MVLQNDYAEEYTYIKGVGDDDNNVILLRIAFKWGLKK